MSISTTQKHSKWNPRINGMTFGVLVRNWGSENINKTHVARWQRERAGERWFFRLRWQVVYFLSPLPTGSIIKVQWSEGKKYWKWKWRVIIAFLQLNRMLYINFRIHRKTNKKKKWKADSGRNPCLWSTLSFSLDTDELQLKCVECVRVRPSASSPSSVDRAPVLLEKQINTWVRRVRRLSYPF